MQKSSFDVIYDKTSGLQPQTKGIHENPVKPWPHNWEINTCAVKEMIVWNTAVRWYVEKTCVLYTIKGLNMFLSCELNYMTVLWW